MNALLAFIPKPVFAGIVVVLLLTTGLQTCRVSDLTDENARYEVAVEQCATTNARNKDTVEFLQLQNSQCLDARRQDETQLANASAAWEAERQLLIENAANVERTTVEVFRDPDCAELAQMDINNVCPDFVDGLRQRAESYNRVRNDNSRSTGTN